MKKSHLIISLLFILLLQACKKETIIDLKNPCIHISLEASQSDKIVEVDNTTNYLDVNIGICDGVVDIDTPDIPNRLVLDVNNSETVNLKIWKNTVCEIKSLTLYYLNDDQQIKKLPYESVLTVPKKVGLYPIIIEGTIYNSHVEKDERIKLILFIKVAIPNTD